jgi:large repetitive protein
MRRNGMSGPIGTKILRKKRNKRNLRPSAAQKSSLRTRLSVGIVLIVLSGAAPAAALNEPDMIALFPDSEGAARHGDVVEVTALYDRDLDEANSGFNLFDNAMAPVGGFFHVTGPVSPTGGYRTAAFHPYGYLSEAKSPYTAKVKARAAVPADPTYTSWRFWIDDTPPAQPVLTSPLDGEVRREQPVLAKGTGDPGSIVVMIDGTTRVGEGQVNDLGVFRIAMTYPPEDGALHTIHAHAVDLPGNVSTPTTPITFTHDSIITLPFIHFPSQGASLNTSSVTFVGDAKPNADVILSENGSGFASTTADEFGSWSLTHTFAAGTHAIVASTPGEGAAPARTFTIDLSAPPAPIVTSPMPGDFLNSSIVEIAGTAEPNVNVRIREAGILRTTTAATASGTFSTTLPFNDGAHTIEVTSMDAAGNLSGSAFVPFTVDTVAPPKPVILAPRTNDFVNTNPVVMSGTGEAGSVVRIFEGTVVIGSASVSGAGTWSTAISFTQAAHSVRAAAFDAAQNQGPLSPYTSFTVDTTPPPAPVITAPAASSTVTTSSVLIAGTAEPGATVQVKEGLTTIGTAGADGSGDWDVVVTMTNGSHTINARAQDAALNLSAVSASRTFTVSVSTDVVAPGAPSLITPAASSLQPSFVLFTGVAEPGSTVHIFEGVVERVSGTANGAGNYRIGVAMFTGSHTVTATATDVTGNTSAATAPRTFMVDADPPEVAFSTASGGIYLPIDDVVLEGTARDAFGVARITIEYYGTRGELVLRADAQTCTGCPGATVTWRAEPPLPLGIYTATAFAVDLVGNRSPAATIHFYRL